MKQSIHIFLKDTRHLKYAIGVVLAWTVMFGVAGTATLAPFQRVDGWFDVFASVVSTLSLYVLPVTWLFLISTAFHDEPIPGDRQFWLTRPYSRGSLLGAKALFVLCYIVLPFGIAQAVGVLFRGFPFWTNLPGLIWSQVVIVAVIVVPAAALASVTSKLTQFVVVGLVVPLLFIEHSVLASWGPLEWIRATIAIGVVATAAGAVLLIQFARRRTHVSRVIAVAGALVLAVAIPLVPWPSAFALQARAADDGTAPKITAELERPQPVEPGPERRGSASFHIALSGPAPKTPIVCEATEATIESPNGVWKTGLVIDRAGTVSTISEGCRLLLPVMLVRQLGVDPVSIQAAVFVTLFGEGQATSIPIDQPPTVVPGAGLCSGGTHSELIRAKGQDVLYRSSYVGCETAFRAPRRLTLFVSPQGEEVRRGPVSYSPFPASLRISPIEDVAYYSQPVAMGAVTVVTRAPIAHVRADVEAQGIHVQDFLR